LQPWLGILRSADNHDLEGDYKQHLIDKHTR
jgi:hypothetical protein